MSDHFPGRRTRLRVAYVTHTAYLDASLCRVRALSEVADVSLFLQIAPESWGRSILDAGALPLCHGVQPGDQFFRSVLPAPALAYLDAVKRTTLIVHDQRRSTDLRAVWTSGLGANAIAQSDPDVVHLDDVELRTGWGILMRRLPPLVMTVHDPLPHSGEGQWRMEIPRRLTYRTVARFILQNRSQMEPFLHKYCVRRSRVDVTLMGAYDVLTSWPTPSPDAPLQRLDMLLLGRLSPYKGVNVLVRAAHLVAQKVPRLRVLIAGEPIPGYSAPPPMTLPRDGRLDVQARHLTTSEAVAAMRTSRFIVLPYLDATQSGVALSAFALGRPVIASKTGGLPEYVQSGINGLLVQPGSPESLAHACVQALTDPDLLRRLEAGVLRQNNALLNWERVASEHLDTYRRAMARR